MSHFSVLVITANRPSPEDLAAALAPFHEFECTGTVNEYVQSVDELQEAREGYATRKERRFKAPDGALFCPYDDQFYRDPTPEETQKIGPFAGSGCGGGMSWSSRDWGDGQGYRAKIHFQPEGFEEVELNGDEVRTFRDFVEYYYERPLLAEGESPDIEGDHKWGWMRINAEGEVTELIDRTNPNAEWDGWVIGGRWSGFLTPKVGVMSRRADDANAPAKGRPGLLGAEADPMGADIIRKGDVDFEAMRNAARQRAAEQWDRIRSIVGDLNDLVSWADIREAHSGDINAARRAYAQQRAVTALRKAGESDSDLHWVDLEDFTAAREDYIEHRAMRSTVTFAALKDGQWAEKGSMGWWGCVSGENQNWIVEFNEMLDGLPDDCWLSVVDCHI